MGGIAYCLTPHVHSRDDAETMCVSWGGHLATVSSQTIWENIKELDIWSCRK